MVGKRRSIAGACGMAALMLGAGAASAVEVSFQQGVPNALVGGNYAGTQDTFLNSQTANQEASYGALTVAIAGHDPNDGSLRSALLRFDLTALQGQYSSINSATLVLRQRETSAQFAPFGMSIYAVSAANGDWVQGTTDTAAPNTAGNPDWLHKSHDTANWAGSAGLMTPGVDYVAAPLATGTWTSGEAGLELNHAPYSFALPTSTIEQWIAGNNPGMLIQKTDLSTPGLVQFSAAEWTADPDGAGPLTVADASSARPLLVIDYTPVPEPTGLAGLALAGIAALRRRRN